MDSSRAALVTGGTGRVGSAIAARLESEGYRVLAAGSADGDLTPAGRGTGARRAGGDRARRSRPRRLRGLGRVRAASFRGGHRGRLGRRARHDRQGHVLRPPGSRALAPPLRGRPRRRHRGRRGLRALAALRPALRGEGGAGDADPRLRARSRSRRPRLRDRARDRGRGARAGGAPGRGVAARPRRLAGRRRERGRLPAPSRVRDRHDAGRRRRRLAKP